MHHQYSLLFLRCLFVILYAHKMHFRFVVTKNIAMNTQREKVYLRCTVHIFSQQLSQTAAAQQKVFYTLFFSPFTTIFLATAAESREAHLGMFVLYFRFDALQLQRQAKQGR